MFVDYLSVSELENREQLLVDRIKELKILNDIFADRIAELEQRDRLLVGNVKVLETKTNTINNQIAELQNQNLLQQRVIDKLTSDNSMQINVVKRLKTKVDAIERLNSKQLESLKFLALRTQDERNHKVTRAVEMDKRNDQAAETVNKIRRAEIAPITVAFTAALGRRMVDLGQNQNIVFEHVETNIGNGYNPHQGVFTAPVAGTYVFYSSLLSDPSFTVNCKIAVNGTGRAGLYTNNLKTGLFQSSQMVIVRLVQGDDVSVQNYFSGGGVFSDAGFASTFSGFLLSQNYGQPATIVG